MAQNSSSTAVGSSALQVLVYWAIVAVPLGWGVYKTVQKSIPLFTGVAPVVAASAASGPKAGATNTPPPLATAPPSAAASPADGTAPVPTIAPAAPADPLVPPAAATPTP